MRPNYCTGNLRPALLHLTLAFALAAMVLCSRSAHAQTFLFDFGGSGANTTARGASPDDPVNYWNNVTEAIGGSPTGLLTNIVGVGNEPSTMGFAIISRFNAANLNGTTDSTLFADDATRDSLYGNTSEFNSLANIFPSFKLTGLDPATAYDFTFYASRTGVSDNRETGYTLAGANNAFTALNAANNIDNVATASAIFPTAEGEITISIAPTANNNNGTTRFTYLGVMKIVAVPPQTPLTFTREPVDTRALQFGDATFTANVTGSLPHFVQWFSNGIPIPGANQLSYTIPAVQFDMDGSMFSVNVSNLAYSVTSSNATLRVVDDLVPPHVVSISSTDGIVIDICFNEALNIDSAQEPFNFIVNEGLIGSPVLNANGRCVALTMSESVSGTFTVAIEWVTDASGNPIALTNVVGEVPLPESQMILIDFGGNNTTTQGAAPADDPIRFWNNVTASVAQSDAGQLASLVTTQNLATTVGFSMIRRFNGVNDNGTMDPSAPFPGDATRDSLFGNTELFQGLTDVFPSFKLTGLSPARSYTLGFYASRTGVSDNRETRYTIEGLTTVTADLNAANNIVNVATVPDVRPSASGEITISLAPGPNNNNTANHFTYLGVLAITPGSGETRFLTPTVSNGYLHLEWTGVGTLQVAPAVEGPWDSIPFVGNIYDEAMVPSGNRFFRILLP